MKHLATTVLLMLIMGINATYYEDCGSVTGTVERVDISGCSGNDEDDRCDLIIDEDQTITIKFKSKVESKSVTAKSYVIIFGTRREDVPLHNTNGCKSGVTCPIHKQEDYTYMETLEKPVRPPTFSIDLVYELIDENNNDIVCVRIPSNSKFKKNPGPKPQHDISGSILSLFT